MRTSAQVRARRLALVSMAALAAVALSACGLARPGTGGASGATASATTTVSAASSASSSGSAADGGGTASAPATGAAGGPGASGVTGVTGGGPVPAGFAATSVTFVSVDEAFVLGTAPCAHAPCTSIVRTLDRGASWAGMPAPVVPLGDPYSNTGQPGAWGIRFASPDEGFVFGNGLWVTTDGGERWTATAGPGGSIVDLEVIDDQLLALTDDCATQSGCAAAETLERRTLAGGAWSVVTRVTNTRVIATQARVAAVLDNGSVVVSADGGLTSATRAAPCPGGPGAAGSAVAVTGPGSLALLCAGDAAMGSVVKTVYVSGDLGATWVKAGSPPFAGDPWSISGGTTARLVVAAASGASWLYYSPDGGAQWLVAFKAGDGGAAFNDLGFTTTADGVAVYGPVYQNDNTYGLPGKLLLSSDGGASWQAAVFLAAPAGRPGVNPQAKTGRAGPLEGVDRRVIAAIRCLES